MKARDLMTTHPSVATPDELVRKAAELMRDQDVGLIPVVDDRERLRLEGVITDRDIAVRCVAAGHREACHVRDHMTSDHLDTVHADASSDEVIRRMEQEQVRRILVVDDDNRLMGIIAQADLALRLGPKDPAKVTEMLEAVSAPAQPLH